jgi:hypothetical protein
LRQRNVPSYSPYKTTYSIPHDETLVTLDYLGLSLTRNSLEDRRRQRQNYDVSFFHHVAGEIMPSQRVVRRLSAGLVLASFVLLSCACNLLNSKSKDSGGGGGGGIPVPVLSSVTPNIVAAGGADQSIKVSGANFQSTSVVMWNAAALSTSFVNASTLVAQVPAANIQSAGTAMVTVVTPAPGGGTSSGGGTSTGATFTIQAPSNPVPTLTSVTPNTAPSGSSATTITATGSNFIASSAILWNGIALVTSYTNATTLTAQVPASDLTTPGIVAITISNPGPGGGASSAVNFTIGNGAQVVTTLANDLAWDPVNQVIYLSLPSTDGVNGNSVQILDPNTAAFGASALAGSEPNLLSVSATSQYLYVSQLGSSTVQALTLPDLGSSSTIQLGSNSFYGPYYAMELRAAPNADGTIAVVRGTPDYSPEEEGGVLIFDSGTARTNALCGWGQSGCPNSTWQNLFDSLQWKSDGSEIFAVNNETSGYDFYTALVDASGFGTVTDYPGLDFANGLGYFSNIHYDATTGYVYGDNGGIIDPSSGTNVGTFAASGLMVPDGTLGAAFFLGKTSQDLGTTNYTLQAYDIGTLVPIDSYTVTNVIGTPTHLIRWGANGLAFTTISNSTTPATGAVYLVNGSLIGIASKRAPIQVEHVQRTWKQRDPLHSLRSGNEGTNPK